ncbi:hypothetical protein K469DRAFT_589019 [Zopfia rhizophila CBS 207.26]|uniref:Uncharacterized protein n=1 Tax=Zopfia rhizophila CBS 207.26 TaxID=1314779 RepID=A0A6A6DPV5_9PEZI|nr:hypothetical protein K469DRAFT_589019 [Zopfia rhizophila CBS 207.26]
MPLPNPKDGPRWKSIDHFSMLPYGWIPDDSIDFFTQFIRNLKRRWLKLCDLAEEHISKRRLDQLDKKGRGSELIHHLAEDAQDWAELRSILNGQVRTARNFAVEHCHRYDDKGLKCAQEAIDGLSDDVMDRISQLDQIVRTSWILLEFAWVSIHEAHKSTSLGTSMKRLSWITFVFLPAIFTSVRLCKYALFSYSS